MIDRGSLRIVLRTLGRHKGFTIVAILSLAIAIALNTTMYSVLDAMFAPHISARRPENLYSLRYYGDYLNRLPPGSIEQALVANLRGYESISGYWQVGMQGQIAENGTSFRRVRPAAVRANFFEFLGTPAIQGRTFQPRDEAEASTVVLSDWLAEQLFPNESPIGRSILFAGQDYAIIGVVERNQRFDPLSFDLWLLRSAGARPVPISLIRFREKIDVRTAWAELNGIAGRLALAASEKPGDSRFDLDAFTVKQFKLERLHWALIGAVVAVLLVACANLANLQLARGLARSRDLALRSAVGASRGQLITHLLAESAVLAVAGLSLGVVLALWGMHLAKSSIPPVMNEYIIQPQLSWRVMVFAAFAAVVCLFLVGLLPAMHVSRVDPDSLLKAANGTGANKAHRRRYGVMVVAQIGFALPVLVGAVVLLQSAWILADPQYLARMGFPFDPTAIISARVPIPLGKEMALADIAADLTARARAIPEVVEATVRQQADPIKRLVSVDGSDGAVRELPANSWSYQIVSPSFLATLKRGMKYGRDFLDGELDGKSVIIDQSTSVFLFGQARAIGRAIKLGAAHSNEPWLIIVGVVGDRRDSSTLTRDYMYGKRLGTVYRVIGPRDSISAKRQHYVMMFARAAGPTEIAAARFARLLHGYNGDRLAYVAPLAEEYYIAQQRIRQNFLASLFGAFGFLGLGLVAIGVYGIVSHSVAERRRELAVRISLGATARNILHAVLREGNALVLAGIALGLLFTKYTIFWLVTFMQTEDGPYNSPLFAAVAAFLFVTAAFAAFLPARRATLIDPVEALRHE